MFSYFESSVDGIIPNEYTSLECIFSDIFALIICIRDSFMLKARRFWLAREHLVQPEFSRKLLSYVNSSQQITETKNAQNESINTTKTNDANEKMSKTPSANPKGSNQINRVRQSNKRYEQSNKIHGILDAKNEKKQL